eukprot:2658318-Rhodomonas_salina.7
MRGTELAYAEKARTRNRKPGAQGCTGIVVSCIAGAQCPGTVVVAHRVLIVDSWTWARAVSGAGDGDDERIDIDLVTYATGLRACYAVSGTDVG